MSPGPGQKKDSIVLFDLDGTLIDAKLPIQESIRFAFEQEKLPIPDEKESASLIGLPLRDIFRQLGAPEGSMDRLVENYRELFLKIGPEKTRLMPGGREALLEAASFAHTGVVTTRVSSYSRILLERLLGKDVELFETIIGFESVKNPKPHPEPVELAVASIAQTRGGGNYQTWMIGDTPLDIQSALGAGVNPVGVRNGHGDLSAYEGDRSVLIVDGVHEGVRTIRGKVVQD